MKTKLEMLRSAKAAKNYKEYYRSNVPHTICRGITRGNDDFFCSDLPFWSDNCDGWIKESSTGILTCSFCFAEREKYNSIKNIDNFNEIRKQSRDSDSIPGQDGQYGESGGSILSAIRSIKEHRSKSNKSNATSENKKDKKVHVQKRSLK